MVAGTGFEAVLSIPSTCPWYAAIGAPPLRFLVRLRMERTYFSKRQGVAARSGLQRLPGLLWFHGSCGHRQVPTSSTSTALKQALWGKAERIYDNDR
jgi:hypothetical protein